MRLYTDFLSPGIKRPSVELIKGKHGRWRLPYTPSMCCISINVIKIIHKFNPLRSFLPCHIPPPGLFLIVILVLKQKHLCHLLLMFIQFYISFFLPKILIWSVYSLAFPHLTINTPPSSWIILSGSSNSLLTIPR